MTRLSLPRRMVTRPTVTVRNPKAKMATRRPRREKARERRSQLSSPKTTRSRLFLSRRNARNLLLLTPMKSESHPPNKP